MKTVSTHHVVAPSILLNADIALGTLGGEKVGEPVYHKGKKEFENVHDCGHVGHTSLVCALM